MLFIYYSLESAKRSPPFHLTFILDFFNENKLSNGVTVVIIIIMEENRLWQFVRDD